ncbi:integrase domain-containing protein [Methylomonas rhizoryzae]|uniref:integrase domain-containing protein n=1 Tax=Methylomonas rhizoryzae TaxID=2608981 RepID=UPI001231EBD3
MEDIKREHVMAYGQALKARVERNELKASTAQLYVSAVNSIMTSATQGEWQTVSPTRDCGIPKRRYIPETSKAMPQLQHEQLQISVDDERITVLLNLQRTLGLRFKEYRPCWMHKKHFAKHNGKTASPSLAAPKAANGATCQYLRKPWWHWNKQPTCRTEHR